MPVHTPHYAHDAKHDDKQGHDHDHDHGHAHSHSQPEPAAHSHAADACCGSSTHAATPPSAPLTPSTFTAPSAPFGKPVVGADGVQTPIHILQMDCPTEEGLLRKKLGDMAGVTGLEFNLMQRVLTVTHAP